MWCDCKSMPDDLWDQTNKKMWWVLEGWLSSEECLLLFQRMVSFQPPVTVAAGEPAPSSGLPRHCAHVHILSQRRELYT